MKTLKNKSVCFLVATVGQRGDAGTHAQPTHQSPSRTSPERFANDPTVHDRQHKHLLQEARRTNIWGPFSKSILQTTRMTNYCSCWRSFSGGRRRPRLHAHQTFFWFCLRFKQKQLCANRPGLVFKCSQTLETNVYFSKSFDTNFNFSSVYFCSIESRQKSSQATE